MSKRLVDDINGGLNMSAYSLIIILIIIIYAFTFIRIRKNKKETKDMDSVRDFHKKYHISDNLNHRYYDYDPDSKRNDYKEVHRKNNNDDDK